MKIIKPSFEILTYVNSREILKTLEAYGRTCYKSEDRITPSSAANFIQMIVNNKHHTILEHKSISVRIVCDRGISHELVRHRLASISQESTRYANYSRAKFGAELTFIAPCFWEEDSIPYLTWETAMKRTEEFYMALVQMNCSAEKARSVLPSSLKTELVITANLREWRHIFSLRCASAAHPQMREIMLPMLAEFHRQIPIIFDDLYKEYFA